MIETSEISPPLQNKVTINRHHCNPVLRPGKLPWRKVATFNPGVIRHQNRVYLLERAAGSLHPFQCVIGLQSSDDGVHFHPESDLPVLTPADLGYPHGSLQDARVVRIEDMFYMTYALRPYSYSCHPNGLGVPDYSTPAYTGFDGDESQNITRSGIAISGDLVHWENVGFTTSPGIDDRNNILFPAKINGQFALLRRPIVGNEQHIPSIWISYSDDLKSWSAPNLLAAPEFEWEHGKIGGAAPPMRTKEGWLMLYHAVDKTSVYRVGAMLLDIENPEKILARSHDFIMQPSEYYETTGLVIPNVIFPTGAFIEDDLLHIYYGCADTCVGYATADLNDLLDYLLAKH